MPHNFDDPILDDNYLEQCTTRDSGYHSIAAPRARFPSSQLNDIDEGNNQGDGLSPEQRRHVKAQVLNLTAPHLDLVNTVEDGFLFDDFGSQNLEDIFPFASPIEPTSSFSRESFSHSNQKYALNANEIAGHALPSTEIVPREPFFGDNCAAGLGTREKLSITKGKGGLTDSVSSDSERTTATAFVNTWLAQFPGKWPSPEIIVALATSSALGPQVVQNAFAKILHSNAVECSHVQLDSESKESSKSSLGTAHHGDTWDEAECSVLEKASAWVTKNKKKCLPFKKNISIPGSEDLARIYKCTFGCGWTFDRKDAWKAHEERVHPQEGWICNLDTTVSISGITRCSYCGISDPALDHLKEIHPKLQMSGSCREKPFGRGKVFYQKDHLVNHFKKIHKHIPEAEFLSRYHFVVQSNFERECFLCSTYTFCDWPDRIAHLATDHFEKDARVFDRESQTPVTLSATNSISRAVGLNCNNVRTSIAPEFNMAPQIMGPSEGEFASISPDVGSFSVARFGTGKKRERQLSASITSLTAVTTISTIADTAASKFHEPEEPSLKRSKHGSIGRDNTYPSPTQLSSEDSRLDDPLDLTVFRTTVPDWTDSFARTKTQVIKPLENLNICRQELLDSRVCGDRNQFFVPASSISEIVTKETVARELRELPVWKYKVGIDEVAEVIRARAPRLFAILTIIRKPIAILDFLAKKIDDWHLPLLNSTLTQVTQKYTVGIPDLNSWHQKGESQSIEKWTSWDFEEFCRVQWWFLSPIFTFEAADKINHYEFDDACVLPYVESSPINQGGFGQVRDIKIHYSHQKFRYEGQKIPSSLAVKRLLPGDEETFRHELAMFSALNKFSHPHILQLLATYRLRGQYHLMFLRAKTDLRSYWMIHQPISSFYETFLWSLKQMTGLADALHLIHSGFRQPLTDEFSLSAEASEEKEMFGRHGDLKPENILWFEPIDVGNSNDIGRLAITDFGLSRFHDRNSRSRVNPDSIGYSPTYEPPEIALRQPVSRAYDIWSLGCVYLEFTTWLLMGSEALKGFEDTREYVIPGTKMSERSFYICQPSKPPYLNAVIKDSVVRWIQSLHHTPRSSRAIHDLLDLIQHGLLVVDQKQRISAEELTKTLNEFLERGKTDISYMLTPVS